MNATKKCPACAEDIKQEAIKCRYCGECFQDEGQTSIEKNFDVFKKYIELSKKDYSIEYFDTNLNQVHMIHTYKQSNALIFIILLFFFIIPAFLYIIFCQETHNDKFIVKLNESGKIIGLSDERHKSIMTTFNKKYYRSY